MGEKPRVLSGIYRQFRYLVYKNYMYSFGEVKPYFCGYVVIPKSHKLYGVPYNSIDQIDCHGGLTYSGFLSPRKYVIGFDTCHFGDSPDVEDEKYCENECVKIIDQLHDNYS